jgi:hypothetical protein
VPALKPILGPEFGYRSPCSLVQCRDLSIQASDSD